MAGRWRWSPSSSTERSAQRPGSRSSPPLPVSPSTSSRPTANSRSSGWCPDPARKHRSNRAPTGPHLECRSTVRIMCGGWPLTLLARGLPRVACCLYHAVMIDAHHHLWDLAAREHRWLMDEQPWATDDELARLRRSFTLADLV